MTKATSGTKHPRIRLHVPLHGYEVAFNRWFTFAQAREIVAYLDALGVSDVYASPYFQAALRACTATTSLIHNKLNAAIGSRADYDAWVAQLQAHAWARFWILFRTMSASPTTVNAWWMDVLENGHSSQYAPYFDIEWQP